MKNSFLMKFIYLTQILLIINFKCARTLDSFVPLAAPDSSSSSSTVQELRVIRYYADHVFLHCPLTSSPYSNQAISEHQIKWVNEINDYSKPDQTVIISSSNLLLSSHVQYQLNAHITYLSCGFIMNNCYFRLKMWKINYIDNPTIDLIVTHNPSLITFNRLNETHGSLSIPSTSTCSNPNEWNNPLDLLKFNCVNNFDLPQNTKYVWMYFLNPTTKSYEIWHRYDIEDKQSSTSYQIFHNPNTKKDMHLSEFLKFIFTEPNYSIKFQCASYYERFNTHDRIYLLADSKNLTLFSTDSHFKPTAAPHHSDNGALIGGLVGGILGFLLLLGLLLLLLFCCLKRRKKQQTTTRTTKHHVETTHSSIILPVQSSASIHHTHYLNTADKASQFSNQIELTDMTNEINRNYDYEEHRTTVRSIAPEIYTNRLVIRKDFDDENVSNDAYNIQYELRDAHTGSDFDGYFNNQGEFHRTNSSREVYVHNYNQQSSQFSAHHYI